MSKILEVLMSQVQRLFSKKNNRGCLAKPWTVRSHDWRVVVFGLMVAILLGVTQFRENFRCEGQKNLDSKLMTQHCWTNGTYTVNLPPSVNYQAPQVGIGFRFEDGQHRLETHNYMRSIWVVLIMMIACSYVAQRFNSWVLSSDSLIALLKLPGYENSPIAKSIKQKNPYGYLTKLRSAAASKVGASDRSTGNKEEDNFKNNILLATGQRQADVQNPKVVFDLDVYELDEPHETLDYYINALIAALIIDGISAFRLLDLRLRRKLILQALVSFAMTSLQFIIPWYFTNDEYTWYGWNYFKSGLWFFLWRLRRQPINVNTIDYDISARIWPTMASCEFSRYGEHKLERFVTTCSISFNQTCSQVFAVIWWLVFISWLFEFCQLIVVLLCAISDSFLSWYLSWLCWPKTREQADALASFRFRRLIARKLKSRASEYERIKLNQLQDKIENANFHKRHAPSSSSSLHVNGVGKPLAQVRPSHHPSQDLSHLNDRERKLLELQSEQISSASLGQKKWYLWCWRDVSQYIRGKSNSDLGSLDMLNYRRRVLTDENGFKEVARDANVYYILYLLHLRLSSTTKMEHIVRRTSIALSTYLEHQDDLALIEAGDEPQQQQLIDENQQCIDEDSCQRHSESVNQQQQQQQQNQKQRLVDARQDGDAVVIDVIV